MSWIIEVDHEWDCRINHGYPKCDCKRPWTPVSTAFMGRHKTNLWPFGRGSDSMRPTRLATCVKGLRDFGIDRFNGHTSYRLRNTRTGEVIPSEALGI